MKKITIHYNLDNNPVEWVAVLTDDLTKVIKDHPDNQAAEVHTGIADELGIWNIHFFTNLRAEHVCDFLAEVDEEGEETLLLVPCDVLIWDESGKSAHNEAVHFTVEVESV